MRIVRHLLIPVRIEDQEGPPLRVDAEAEEMFVSGHLHGRRQVLPSVIREDDVVQGVPAHLSEMALRQIDAGCGPHAAGLHRGGASNPPIQGHRS